MKAIYVAPLVAIAGGGIGLAFLFKRWRKNEPERKAKGDAEKKRDDYDDRIDAELKDLDDG